MNDRLRAKASSRPRGMRKAGNFMGEVCRGRLEETAMKSTLFHRNLCALSIEPPREILGNELNRTYVVLENLCGKIPRGTNNEIVVARTTVAFPPEPQGLP